MIQMLVDERSNEKIAVVIAPAHLQLDRMVRLFTGVSQSFRVKLLFQEIIRRALINEQRQALFG